VAAVLVAGCGGGGDAPADPAATSSLPAGSTPAPASPSPPAASPAPAAGAAAPAATCGLPDFAASALARINQIRAAGAMCGSSGTFGPAAPLAWSAPLTQASAGHSQDMAASNYFSHTSLDGRTLRDRVDATGYSWSSLGENIAAGYATVNEVVDGWVASPGHCANLLNPNFNQFGLACVPRTATGGYRTYWTMDLARSR
jgi:uncharacterized protein YkwD